MAPTIALTGLGLAGSYLTSQGQRSSAAAEQRAYNARAFNQEMQAADMETERLLVREQTDIEATRLRRRINQTRASQNAAVAASGVEFSGSARQVVEVDAAEQEFNALMLQFQGMSRQIGLQRGAAMERMNANTLRSEGRFARAQGRSRASMTLLGGAVNAYDRYNTLSMLEN